MVLKVKRNETWYDCIDNVGDVDDLKIHGVHALHLSFEIF